MLDYLERKNIAVQYDSMTSQYSSSAHFCLVFLVLVTLDFITQGPLLGKDLIWVDSCPLFTGDSDPVATFSTSAWSDTEGSAPVYPRDE